MGTRMFLRSGIVLAAIFTVAFFAGSESVMAASKNCSILGAWHGVNDKGITWMGTITRGPSATVGQLELEWVSFDLTLGYPALSAAVRATSAMGVWSKVNQKTYKYTWIAYGLAVDGSTVYVARASGILSLVNCSTMNITYVLEVFDPLQDISTESPTYGTVSGTGTATRMSLV